MAADGDPHLSRMRRLLAGEVINGEAGIRLRGGPFADKIQIGPVDGDNRPVWRIRIGRSRGDGSWHIYEPAVAEDVAPGWVYEYCGSEPFPGSERVDLSVWRVDPR
jgi:hypothetical protein